MISKEERLRLKSILTDTVAMICKNGLSTECSSQFSVDGVIGISLDTEEQIYFTINQIIKTKSTSHGEKALGNVTKKRKTLGNEVYSTKVPREDRTAVKSQDREPYSCGNLETHVRTITPTSCNIDNLASFTSEIRNPPQNELAQLMLQKKKQHSQLEPTTLKSGAIKWEQNQVTPVIVQPEQYLGNDLQEPSLITRTPILSPQIPPMPPNPALASTPTIPMERHADRNGVNTQGQEAQNVPDIATVYGQLGQVILRSPGSFVTSRMINRLSHHTSHAIRDVMYALGVPANTPNHIGTTIELPEWNNMLVFYKCPPSFVKETALLKYGIERMVYTKLFHTPNIHLPKKLELQKHIMKMAPYRGFQYTSECGLSELIPSSADLHKLQVHSSKEHSRRNDVNFISRTDAETNLKILQRRGNPLSEKNFVAKSRSYTSSDAGLKLLDVTEIDIMNIEVPCNENNESTIL